MNELDALARLGRGLASIFRKGAAALILFCEAVGFTGLFLVFVLAIVLLLLLFYLVIGPSKPAAPPEENWVEVSNRLERENNQAAIRACLTAGGVPIFGSVWHSKITDCKFPPKEAKR